MQIVFLFKVPRRECRCCRRCVFPPLLQLSSRCLLYKAHRRSYKKSPQQAFVNSSFFFSVHSDAIYMWKRALFGVWRCARPAGCHLLRELCNEKASHTLTSTSQVSARRGGSAIARIFPIGLRAASRMTIRRIETSRRESVRRGEEPCSSYANFRGEGEKRKSRKRGSAFGTWG